MHIWALLTWKQWKNMKKVHCHGVLFCKENMSCFATINRINYISEMYLICDLVTSSYDHQTPRNCRLGLAICELNLAIFKLLRSKVICFSAAKTSQRSSIFKQDTGYKEVYEVPGSKDCKQRKNTKKTSTWDQYCHVLSWPRYQCLAAAELSKMLKISPYS